MKSRNSESGGCFDLREELVRDCRLLIEAKRLLLQRQALYPSRYSETNSLNLRSVDRRFAIRLAQLSLLNSAEAQLQTKFDPNQPRVPAGRPEGGRWTSGTDGTGREGSDNQQSDRGQAIASIATQPASGGRGVILAGSPFSGSPKSAVTIDYSRAMTGISTIDDATKKLCETLGESMQDVDFLPDWTPQVYGTAVHVDFGVRVRLGEIPGIGWDDVEQSFSNQEEVGYGRAGSIRTDVVLRNDIGDIIAIYDLKTGEAGLDASRVRELRRQTGAGPEIPIIELHVRRGASIKATSLYTENSRRVIAVLWRRVHLDIWGPAAVA